MVDPLRIVLVTPRNPLNIGAVARAMSNFGFTQLRLVNPYDVAFKEARSAVNAHYVLENAEIFATVAEAVADCGLVTGTTSVGHRDLHLPLYRLEPAGEIIRENLSAEKPVALFYSRFHRKKRLLELIDSWLENAPRDWLLLVVGIPEDYTPSSLEAYVLRAGHAGRVRAFDGFGHPPPYAVASLFVLPSHGENFGLSIAEALASGVPALVTTATPWSGLNTNGAGWCVPWSEYGAALKAATAEAPETLKARGAVGRKWALNDYSWSKPASILSNFYATLRKGVGSPRP